MIIYFDQNFPPHVAKGFAELQGPEGLKSGYPVEVRYIPEEFYYGIRDEDWIPLVGQNDACIITKDIHISRRKQELALYKEHKLGMFFMRGPNRKQSLNTWESIQALAKHWASITEFAHKLDRPFAFEFSLRGSLQKKHDEGGLDKITLGEFIPLKGNSLDPRKHPDKTFELYSVPSHETRQPEIVKGKEIGASKQVVENDWVLLSRINPHLNRCWVVKSHSDRTKIASSEWVMFPPHRAFFPDYLGYYLVQSRVKNLMLANISGVGGSLTRTNKNAIREFDLALPPLPEQRAIVAKLEQLFSELDSGIANMQRAQEKLKVYRQAVLKKAFEGELTKEWREQQKDLPTAEVLLKQIKEERCCYFEQQLSDWQAAVTDWEKNGKDGKKPGKPKLIKKPISDEEIIDPFALPKGWQWCDLYDMTQKVSDGPFGSHLKGKDYIDSGIRVVRLENIKALWFDDSKQSFVSPEKYATIKKHTVYPGEIIFSTFIADTTKVVVLPPLFDFAINKADCVQVKPIDSVSNKYLQYYLASRITYSLLVNLIHGATRPRINTTQLKLLRTPLCTSVEQNQIVQEIESRLSVCDKLEERITTNLLKAEALRQSILKKAFDGRLLSKAELEACKKEKDWCPAGELLGKSNSIMTL